MPVFSWLQKREKWALFYANQIPQPLAIVSAITFTGIVFFAVCLFTEKSAQIASKFIFDFHIVSREKLNIKILSAALNHFVNPLFEFRVFRPEHIASLNQGDIVVFDAAVFCRYKIRHFLQTFLKPIRGKILFALNFGDFLRHCRCCVFCLVFVNKNKYLF